MQHVALTFDEIILPLSPFEMRTYLPARRYSTQEYVTLQEIFTSLCRAGALMGFALFRVFPLLAIAELSIPLPLMYFEKILPHEDSISSPVLQSFIEQEDWLISEEIADPFEVYYLVL